MHLLMAKVELLEKGRLLDRTGRYDDAWTEFAEGKKLGRELSGQPYLDGAAQQRLDRLRGFFSAGRMRLVPRAGIRADVPQPIFILVFPSLRHRTGRADSCGPSEDRRRRRTPADPRDHRHHAAHVGVATPQYVVRLDRATDDPNQQSG